MLYRHDIAGMKTQHYSVQYRFISIQFFHFMCILILLLKNIVFLSFNVYLINSCIKSYSITLIIYAIKSLNQPLVSIEPFYFFH